MKEIIASTYEVIEKLGEGGFGVVYRAKHIRLSQEVVLKADQRSALANTDKLRREVDILKQLNHPFIPRVYDYFTENGIVYTAMEYIEGESLNKPLQRKEKISQPQVIKWAVQLLNALVYLHSPKHGDPPKGYIHSDIKPANIMLRKNGDVSLIDFNVSYALGEHAVGKSPGYSSPEHYGYDYTSSSLVRTVTTSQRGELADTGKRKILPDVRSDIYCLGATLYHLLSGKRPAENAKEVIPLSEKQFSKALVEIVTKAMNPNPDLRYQSAEEMLNAFLSLRTNDYRAKRIKRQSIISNSLLGIMAVMGMGAAYLGMQQMTLRETVLKNIETAKSLQLEGNSEQALENIMKAFPEQKGFLRLEFIPEAQKVLTDILGVYDLSERYIKNVLCSLPSEPIDIKLSPNENIVAFVCKKEIVFVDISEKKILTCLETDPDFLAEICFVENDKVVYTGTDGLSLYDLKSNQLVWKNPSVSAICVSSDHSVIAGADMDKKYAVIYDSADGKEIERIEFEDKLNIDQRRLFTKNNDYVFQLNGDGSSLAASFEDGSLVIFRLSRNMKDGKVKILQSESGYDHFEGGFYKQYFAFSATRNDMTDSAFVVIDLENLEQTVGFDSEGYYFTKVDSNGIAVGIRNILVQIDPETGEQRPLVDTNESIADFSGNDQYMIITSGHQVTCFDNNAIEVCSMEQDSTCDLLASVKDKVIVASRDSKEVSLLSYNTYSEYDFLKYDSAYEHQRAQVSADEERVLLASPDKFRIYDMDGSIVSDAEIPDADNVYANSFIRNENETYLEVIYEDGLKQTYDVDNGILISNENELLPDHNLDQVFETDMYRFEVPFRESIKIYQKDKDELVAELEEEGYLVRVFEDGDYIIMQFMTSDLKFYGCIMNQDFQTIAYVPYLCDVYKGEIFMDYPSGYIRKTKLFSLNELIKVAKERGNQE